MQCRKSGVPDRAVISVDDRIGLSFGHCLADSHAIPTVDDHPVGFVSARDVARVIEIAISTRQVGGQMDAPGYGRQSAESPLRSETASARGRRPGSRTSRIEADPDPLAVTDPAFEIASMHDAKHKDHSVVVDHVVHHAVIAHPEPVERVTCAADGLDRLAADATLLPCIARQPVKSATEPVAGLERQLSECSGRRRCKPDLIGGQTRSLRPTVRPFA